MIPQISLPPKSDDEIRATTTMLLSEIQARQAEVSVLKTLREQVQKFCKHVGQKTGHNNRDGSWGNPCPTCGYSY